MRPSASPAWYRSLRLVPPNSVVASVLGVVGLLGCQGLTSVDAPDVVTPGGYTTAAGATALAAGAVTQFHIAFGGDVGQVRLSGYLADELTSTSRNNQTGDGPWDTRSSQDPANSTEPYTTLHDTRQRLLTAINMFQQVAPDSNVRIGHLFALLGYTSVFLAETYCAGVPLSHRDADLQPVYGEPLTTIQLFDSAMTAFDSALVYGADSARITDLSRVGQGRALLNLGRFSDAAQVVATVPTSYVYNAVFLNDPEFANGFFDPDSPTNGIPVPDVEGKNGLNWRSAGDPRVPLASFSPPLIEGEAGIEVLVFAPYRAAEAPLLLAGGVEARLIEAEAALQAGDALTWLTIHNTLRATVSGLGPLADPGSTDARVDLHFRERAFWLFLTGHRQGDLRRLVRQYGRDAETVFPTGIWRAGIRYGNATSMAPPATQNANPYYAGCLNRDA